MIRILNKNLNRIEGITFSRFPGLGMGPFPQMAKKENFDEDFK